MAIIQKTLFPENLDRYSVLIDDNTLDSKYFKITELSDTLTGGKNAFLIQGSQYLVPDTLIRIEIKDSQGNIIYHEPGEGIISASVGGEPILTEYFEGVSKVVAVYVYPDTAFGPATITILGEASTYDNNGLTTPVPTNWQGTYNVKWQRQVNINPSLANTTKIRFYRRPTVTISELLDPIYRIDATTGLKINTGINQSFANIKVSNLETFAGDVKRVKVFRTSLGDISDYDMIQDILVESKELLTTFGLSGSVIGNTGTFTSETLKNYWITGSLTAYQTSSRVESGVALNGSGYFRHSASLDIRNTNTYELNLDAFYSSSTNSNLGIYLSQVTTSIVNGVPTPTTISSSIATLIGTQPTKNLLDTVIPFKIDRNYPSASLYFSQSQGEWHLGNISLRLSQDTAFSPDEISFITTMPTVVGNEDFNFKFEFYDVNNNYVPILVTGSANFTGGSNAITKLLTFESDRTAFRFSTGSYANPPNQNVRFKTIKTNFTGAITYASSAFDVGGNYIEPSNYISTATLQYPTDPTKWVYPGWFTSQNQNGALLSIASFSGSVTSSLVGSIVYTASCEGFEEYETIYRFEDGDNAPGVFVTANTNQFIYKATTLELNPDGQTITIEAKRKNLGTAGGLLTVNSAPGTPPLTLVGPPGGINGVNTYTLAGSSYPYSTGERIYYISGSDQFGNEFSDAIKISPVKILDGFSVAVTNENTSFPAYSTGNVFGGFAASSGSITVKVGNETINYSPTFVTNSFSASISAFSNLTPNTFNGTNYSINSLSADSGSLTLLVKYKDGGGTIISSSKEITYSKAKVGTPNVVVAVTPAAQSVTANSLGNNASAPTSLVVTALEGGTNRLVGNVSAVGTGVTIGTISGGTIPLSAVTTDNASVAISVNYTDSEGTTGTKTLTATISKAKAAAPTTLALLSSETQTILSSSAGYAAPTTFTTTVTEGGSSYGYDASLSTNSTYYTTINSGGTAPINGTIQPTTPTTNAGTTVSLTISYKNSEGSTGTITKTHKVAVSLEGIQGVNGGDGKRTSANMVHYQLASATAPPTPTATSFTFTTGVFTGLTANWSTGAPTYASGNTNKYWYSSYTVVETAAGSGIGTPTFGTPTQAIGFSGLVSFTSANAIDNGLGNSLSFGVAGATLINGSNISTGKIISTNYQAGTPFTTAGSIIDLDNGRIATKTFYVDANGDAVFKGTLSAAAGTFAGSLSAAAGTFTGELSGGTISIGSGNTIFKADTNGIYLGNATFASAPFRVTPAGALTATNATISGNITATSLTLSAGVTIANTQVTGLGTLATQNNVSNTQVTGLGTLSTLNSLALGSAQLTGFGDLAARSTVNATYIDSNSITTDKILANTIVAGKIASLEFYGKTAKFDTGDVGGWIMDGTGLYKTTGAYTLRLGANSQRISISQASNSDSIDRVRIDASTSIPVIALTDTGSLNWANSGQSLASINAVSNPFNSTSGTTGYVLANGGSNQYGTGVFGIIGLQYGEEEIFVEAENFPNIESTIGGIVGAEGGSYYYGRWRARVRVRRFPSDTDALNQTNVDTTFGINGVDVRELAIREILEYSNFPEYNIDNTQIFGATIQAQGGGGINTIGTARWYRVEIEQDWSLEVYKEGTVGPVSVSARRPAADIFVKFGRVNNGYSIFSPGGLQVYQGVKNYLNASSPSGSTGDESNFFIVKGKSQIIGSLNVSSGFSAGFKNFKIEHPLNENKWLYHTSTESPRADLIYRGTLQLQSGEGSASIDSASSMTNGTFDILTKNPQLFLQNNESFDRIKGYVESGSVYVLSENQNSTASIDWSVIAERRDSEILKSPLYDRNGKYKTENYKGEYLKIPREERLINFTGSV